MFETTNQIYIHIIKELADFWLLQAQWRRVYCFFGYLYVAAENAQHAITSSHLDTYTHYIFKYVYISEHRIYMYYLSINLSIYLYIYIHTVDGRNPALVIIGIPMKHCEFHGSIYIYIGINHLPTGAWFLPAKVCLIARGSIPLCPI